MAELIPTVNGQTEEEFRMQAALLHQLRPQWVQVDVADGILGSPRNFANPRLAAEVLQGFTMEAHLMVQDVRPAVDAWAAIQPTRITVHVEAVTDMATICAGLREQHIECGLALGPSTPVERVQPFLGTVDFLLFVAVPPGPSGQRFDPTTPERVRAARRLAPNLPIGVDGGVTATHIRGLLAAGVTVICVGSAIFRARDPQAAYQELKLLAGEGDTLPVT